MAESPIIRNSAIPGKKSVDDYNMDGEDNIDYATVKGADGEGMPAWFTLNVKRKGEC